MADIFAGTEPPAWLQRMTAQTPGLLGSVVGELVGGLADSAETAIKSASDKQAKGENTNWIKELPGSIKPGLAEARLNIQDPLWRIQAQQAQLRMAGEGLNIQQQQQAIDFNKQRIGLIHHDQSTFADWMQKYPTWESRQSAPAPVLYTSDFQHSFQGILLQDGKAMQAKATVASINNFNKTVDEALRLGIDVSEYVPYQNKGPVPDNIKEKLDKAIADKKGAATPKPSAAIQDVNQISEWERQARDADARGDTAAAKELRDKATMLREQMKGENVVMGYDDQGRAIFAMGKGAQLPTVATQSMAQGKLLQYENATELMNYLEQNMTEEHVGLAGASGEFIFDKTLAQFFPGSANKDRIKVRTTLTGLREGLLREMADDRSGRFTRADRDEIEKALPSSGVFESKEDAMQRIARVREILANRGKVYARSLGVKPPTWTLSVDEIKKMYQDGLASKLDPNTKEFKQKYLTKEEAVDALTRFH